ncbi:MAG: hypothetical protein ACLFQV_08195 [Vulcanimicrobiota bacterium]
MEPENRLFATKFSSARFHSSQGLKACHCEVSRKPWQSQFRSGFYPTIYLGGAEIATHPADARDDEIIIIQYKTKKLPFWGSLLYYLLINF